MDPALLFQSPLANCFFSSWAGSFVNHADFSRLPDEAFQIFSIGIFPASVVMICFARHTYKCMTNPVPIPIEIGALVLQKGGITAMAVVQHNSSDVSLLARLMRAEAEGDGQLGMLMVGNVGVNRVLGNCLDFEGLRTIQQMVFQSPGGFEATQKGYFYQAARSQDKRLAQRALNGERFHPASNALWFFQPAGTCPAQWYSQWNTGRFKAHCFFSPTESDCPNVY